LPVYEINPLQDPRWKALVGSHPCASVFHDTSWLESLQSAYDYEPLVISTCSPSAPLTNGFLFCRVTSWLTGRRYVSLPFSDHCDPLVDSVQQMNELLLHMSRMVVRSKWKYVEIRPTALEPSSETNYVLEDSYYHHRLDLRRSKEELFRSFHKDCVQRKIRRAERESLVYDEGNSEALLNKFYRLLVKSRIKQNLPPQPLAWFRSLMAAFGERLKIRVASKGERPVASILTLAHKQSMTYKYGCSEPQSNKFGGMALLFWRTIEEATAKGLEELDMGRSDVNNSGLITFKEHWGATRYPLSYWQYRSGTADGKTPMKVRGLPRIFSVSPEWLLITAGRLLYRHIG
jgi:CelD/BcsL family acetyltransferase involved in cellulose biosynthesis